MWLCLLVISSVLGHELSDETKETDRNGRDLVLENMVMRTKKYKPQDNQASPMVGGGILERKIITARNGTEGNHAEDREMECCHQVLVGGDHFGGVHLTHPYITGKYKKIGVCDGRSLYQNINNTEIFLYYVCGRWFIGLEIGVCGGWVFTKTWDICVHGQHQRSWNFVSELGLEEDNSFRVQEDCEEPSLPSDTPRAQPLRGGVSPSLQDYVDRTDMRVGKEGERGHAINTGALYRQPLLNSQGDEGKGTENNNYLLGLLYKK